MRLPPPQKKTTFKKNHLRGLIFVDGRGRVTEAAWGLAEGPALVGGLVGDTASPQLLG